MTKVKQEKDVSSRLKTMDDRTARFLSLLPRSSDLLIVLLKGHLLLEEQLYSVLCTWMPDSSCLEKARLNFNQKLHLAKGIVGVLTGRDELWSALQELNAIRNKLAHQIEPGDIETLTAAFITICESDRDFEGFVRKPVFYGATKLHLALVYLFTTLNALTAAAEVVRDHSPMPTNLTTRSKGTRRKRPAPEL